MLKINILIREHVSISRIQSKLKLISIIISVIIKMLYLTIVIWCENYLEISLNIII